MVGSCPSGSGSKAAEARPCPSRQVPGPGPPAGVPTLFSSLNAASRQVQGLGARSSPLNMSVPAIGEAHRVVNIPSRRRVPATSLRSSRRRYRTKTATTRTTRCSLARACTRALIHCRPVSRCCSSSINLTWPDLSMASRRKATGRRLGSTGRPLLCHWHWHGCRERVLLVRRPQLEGAVLVDRAHLQRFEMRVSDAAFEMSRSSRAAVPDRVSRASWAKTRMNLKGHLRRNCRHTVTL